jgi:hypothetical protein
MGCAYQVGHVVIAHTTAALDRSRTKTLRRSRCDAGVDDRPQ